MLRYLLDNGLEPFMITVDPALASYPLTDESLEKDIHPGINVFKIPIWGISV